MGSAVLTATARDTRELLSGGVRICTPVGHMGSLSLLSMLSMLSHAAWIHSKRLPVAQHPRFSRDQAGNTMSNATRLGTASIARPLSR